MVKRRVTTAPVPDPLPDDDGRIGGYEVNPDVVRVVRHLPVVKLYPNDVVLGGPDCLMHMLVKGKPKPVRGDPYSVYVTGNFTGVRNVRVKVLADEVVTIHRPKRPNRAPPAVLRRRLEEARAARQRR